MTSPSDNEAYFRVGIWHNDFDSHFAVPFNSTNCVQSGLCSTEEPGVFLESLKLTSPEQLFEILRNYLMVPWKESDSYWEESHEGKGNPTEFFPTFVQQVDLEKLGIVLGFYLVLAVFTFMMYRHRKRLVNEYDFKLSMLSKMIFRYLVLKLVSTIVYFVFLVMFSKNLLKDVFFQTPYLFDFFAIWNFLLSVVSFSLVVLFSLGYGTKRYTMDTWMRFKTLILTILYFFQTLTSLIRELDEIRSYWQRDFATYQKVSVGVVFIAVVTTVIYFGMKTYCIDKDKRFIKSAILICGGVLLNPLVVLPSGDFSNIFVVQVVGAGAREMYGSGKHIPEILEVLVLAGLIYIWRDNDETEPAIPLQPILNGKQNIA